METINGYTVIASHPRGIDAERVILAALRRGGYVEYVTAIAKLGPVTEWYWGHYFGGSARESTLFLDAVNDFCQRAGLVFEEVSR
jgi:hypothetical protein